MLGGQIVDRVIAKLTEIEIALKSISGQAQTHAFWRNRVCKSVHGPHGQGFLIKVFGIDKAGITFQAEEDSGNGRFTEGEVYFISFNDRDPITLRTLRQEDTD